MVPMYVADAFTDEPFLGNPAGVCLLDAPREDAWMQRAAMEMNQAETAFLSREEGDYRLRWFTPVTEVDLCGHATLASAHVLWEQGHVPSDREIRFRTRSGELIARREADGWIRLDFPLEPVTAAEPPEGLAEALGAAPLFFGRNRMDWLIELESEETVAALRPNIGLLLRLPCPRGFIVTSRSGPSREEADFVSRFFCPAIGVDEDPVTGSAHCALGPYWAGKLGKNRLNALQLSRRGGRLRLEVGERRVYLYGRAVTTLQGFMIR